MSDNNASSLTDSRARFVEIPPIYASLFRSNVCPSAEVCTDIQSLIQTYERELGTLQGDVDELKRRLLDLERRQVLTQDVLIQLHAALSPIKRLPPEILSEIFERCLDGPHTRALFATAARNKLAPLLLGRVCRSWRAVAYTTPRLWQDVLVNVCDGRYSDKLRTDALPALKTWLAHSGSLPLNLLVLCKTERVLPGMIDIFETIALHGSRWKRVHVRVQNAPLIYRLVYRTFSRCTALSMLDVTDGGHTSSFFGLRQSGELEEMNSANLDLSSSPLRHLSLSLAGLTIRDVCAPWAKLTSLSFMHDARTSTSSITDYVAALKQCTSLKECGIAIDSGARDAPLEPFTLPNLESLRLQALRQAGHTTQVGDFLNALDAPRLTTIAIEDSGPRREVVLYHGPVKAFLQAHAKTLRHLKLTTNSKFFTSQDIIALVEETPSLIELEYHPDEESSPRALLEALTPRLREETDARAECLLPCLERLFVYWDATETVAMVGDMVEKRYAMAERGITRLKYLSCKPVKLSLAYDCMPVHLLVENLAERLEPLCRRGLQLDWEAYRYDVEFLYC